MRHNGRTPAHIAIVGCGYTGTSAFHQLVGKYPVREITIFERSADFGPGYPYRLSETPDYLINNTADTMGIVPGNRRAFVEWLATRPDLVADLDETGHYPRAFFGVFLKEIFDATLKEAADRNVAVRLVPHEVVDVVEAADGRVVLSHEGGAVEADAAILATGRCPDIDAYGTPGKGSRARYYPTHIPGDVLDDIPLDATCHVLGASLSAYDVVNRLFSPETGCRFAPMPGGGLDFVANGNGRRIILCSRSGRLKKMQSRSPAKQSRTQFTRKTIRELADRGEFTLERIAALVRHDVEQASDTVGAGIDWRAVFSPYAGCRTAGKVDRRAADILAREIEAARSGPDSTANYLVEYLTGAELALWEVFAVDSLSLEDELRYRQRFETTMLSYAAPCPIETAERVLALMKAGRLSIRRGVSGVGFNAADDCYDIHTEAGMEKAAILINTTGSVDRRVNSDRQDALYARMRESGLIRAYVKGGREMGGIAVDMRSFRAKGARNIYVASQFLWGPGFFVSSARMMATIAGWILESIFAPDQGGE